MLPLIEKNCIIFAKQKVIANGNFLMEKVSHIASYLLDRYKKQFGETMDEIKLQKLLYFTQQEAIIRTGGLMFDAEFRAWKFGPVIQEIHERYKTDDLHEELPLERLTIWKECFDYIFEQYATKSTMSLVGHSHCQKSWERARVGYGKYERSDVPMKMSDIIEDAEDMKKWRASLPMRRKVYSFIEQHPDLRNTYVIPHI